MAATPPARQTLMFRGGQQGIGLGVRLSARDVCLALHLGKNHCALPIGALTIGDELW